jgi:acetate kinase
MIVLIVNAGSSSHKFALYKLTEKELVDPFWSGMIDWQKADRKAVITISNAKSKILNYQNHSEVIQSLLAAIWKGNEKVLDDPKAIQAIGHRIVHGGSRFIQPTIITHDVKEEIKLLIPLAPLHNPANLEGIDQMEALFPSIPQIAVFDTAYHATIPEFAKTYPIPLEWRNEGIIRYGFHGISHQYCALRAAELLNKDPTKIKMINCHLGSGCSLCAIKEGKSIDTTMGMTPLEGLMMGTRSGSIDPGILFYLIENKRFSANELHQILNFQSGLKAIGGTADMRALQQKGHWQAKLAIEMFVYRLKLAIGSLAMALEGFNVLCFTAGIGENSAFIRKKTCEGLKHLNIFIDQEKNQNCHSDSILSTKASQADILVINTKEDWMIAQACYHLLNSP